MSIAPLASHVVLAAESSGGFEPNPVLVGVVVFLILLALLGGLLAFGGGRDHA